MKDKVFIADATKLGFNPDPTNGKDVAEIMRGVIKKTPPDVRQTGRKILGIQ